MTDPRIKVRLVKKDNACIAWSSGTLGIVAVMPGEFMCCAPRCTKVPTVPLSSHHKYEAWKSMIDKPILKPRKYTNLVDVSCCSDSTKKSLTFHHANVRAATLVTKAESESPDRTFKPKSSPWLPRCLWAQGITQQRRLTTNKPDTYNKPVLALVTTSITAPIS